MSKYFTLLCLLFASGIYAQTPITVTSTDMPVVNDTLRYSTADTTGLKPGIINAATGPNYTWNYGALVPVDQFLQSFKSSASTPYFLYFSGMVGYKRADSISLGPLTQKNVWDFYKTTATKYTIEGTGFTTSNIPLASDYSDPDELYNFPLNYNDKDSTTFAVKTTIPGFGEYIQAGSRVSIVDGWGKVTTPFGTFDALRVKSMVYEIDTIKITSPISFTLPFPNNHVEYRWLAKGIHIPVLEIIMRVAPGIGTVSIQSVRYRDQARFIPKAPTANFTADMTYAKINDVVKLTDQSIDAPTRWKWTITPNTYTLANGSVDTLQNIDVKFTANGNYTVSLRAQNAIGQNTATKNAYIHIGNTPVIAFGADKKNANINDLVTLTDSSTNTPTRWKWTILPSTYTFNTGSVDTLKSIGVKFTKGGFYTIDLKVTNPWGSDQTTKTNYIWIAFPAGINTLDKTAMYISPNPVRDALHLQLNSGAGSQVKVYNANGALVQEETTASDMFVLHVEQLPKGMYVLQVVSNGALQQARFIKE